MGPRRVAPYGGVTQIHHRRVRRAPAPMARPRGETLLALRLPSPAAPVSGPERTRSRVARLLFAAALALGPTVTGLLFMVGGVLPSPVRPNPYVGFALLCGGVVLVATLAKAAIDSGWIRDR